MLQGNKEEEQKGFRKLRVWQEAHKFVLMIYKATERFPKDEFFCLTLQIRRAVISIPANIVEGYAYRSNKKLLQYLNIANGSLAEIEYYLELSLDLKYFDQKTYLDLEGQRQKIGAYLMKFIKVIKD